MKTLIKLANFSQNLWIDGQNNYYQETNGYMYPYDRFQNQILNEKIKFRSDQFSKMTYSQPEAPPLKENYDDVVINQP